MLAPEQAIVTGYRFTDGDTTIFYPATEQGFRNGVRHATDVAARYRRRGDLERARAVKLENWYLPR